MIRFELRMGWFRMKFDEDADKSCSVKGCPAHLPLGVGKFFETNEQKFIAKLTKKQTRPTTSDLARGHCGGFRGMRHKVNHEYHGCPMWSLMNHGGEGTKSTSILTNLSMHVGHGRETIPWYCKGYPIQSAHSRWCVSRYVGEALSESTVDCLRKDCCTQSRVLRGQLSKVHAWTHANSRGIGCEKFHVSTWRAPMVHAHSGLWSVDSSSELQIAMFFGQIGTPKSGVEQILWIVLSKHGIKHRQSRQSCQVNGLRPWLGANKLEESNLLWGLLFRPNSLP